MLEPGSRPQTLRDFESVLAFRNHISDLPIPPLQIALYTFFAILGPLFLIRLGRWIDTTLSERAIPVEVPLPGPARPAWRGENLSNPSITDSAKPGKIVCYDPATAYHLADIDADTPATIEEKIEKATHAQISWAQSEFGARRRLMNTLKKWIVDDMENIARVAARDTGKTVSVVRLSVSL